MNVLNGSDFTSFSNKRSHPEGNKSSAKRTKVNQEKDIQSIMQGIQNSITAVKSLLSKSKDKSCIAILSSQLNHAKDWKVNYLKRRGDTLVSEGGSFFAKQYYVAALEVQKIYSREMAYFQSGLKCAPINPKLHANISQALQRISSNQIF